MTTTFLIAGIIVMIYIISILRGGVVANIPQNYVGAVFLFGLRLRYVVSTKEDLMKLLPPGIGPRPNQGKVRIASDPTFGLLSKILNVRVYSFNPFASIKPAEIFKNHWKKPGAVEPNGTLRDRLDLPTESEKERFLLIESTMIGFDENVELQGLSFE